MAALHWLKRPIAHRGLHDGFHGIVENSASAVKAAMHKGYAIEADLQCANGHEPVVFHDRTLDRLTGETGAVADRDVDELRAIQLKGTTDRILSLPDLLDLVGGYVPIVLEVKSTWSRDGIFEANIAKAVADYQGPLAVMSFDPHTIAAFARLAPGLPRGLVAGRFDNPHHWNQVSRAERFAMRHLLTSAFARPNFVAYDIQALPALAPLIAKAVFGLPLLTWTVKTDFDRDRALRYADAMIFEGIDP